MDSRKLNRRQFLGACAAAGIARAAPERPNILVLMADQQSPHVLGCYGDPIVRTPHVDSLAAGGVKFDHTYCQAPVCVPSRMSFLTGRQPSENRVWSNGDFLPSDIPTFAHSLGAAGYDTTLIGRMHFNGVDQWHGFSRRLVGDLTPMYPHIAIPLTPELLLGAQNATHRGLQAAGYGKTAYQAFDEDVTSATVSFLREKGKTTGKPFCAVSGFVLPHAPYVCHKEDWDYYLERVTVPEIPADYFSRLHPAIKQWRKVRGLEEVTTDEIRRARAGYYGLVTQFDRQVGRIMAALREAGLERNTIVILTSDHGEMAGELGMWWKSSFYEGSVSVPLIVSWPGRLPPGRRVGEITSMVDIGPTLAELGGAAPMPLASGRSLVPLLRGETTQWPNEAFSEFPPSSGTPAIRMIRSGKWKLIHYEGMAPQLFDLESDPQEMKDLAESPRHRELCRRLEARALDGWSAEEIKREQAQRARSQTLLRQWAQQVHPDAPQQWMAPDNVNVYTLPH